VTPAACIAIRHNGLGLMLVDQLDDLIAPAMRHRRFIALARLKLRHPQLAVDPVAPFPGREWQQLEECKIAGGLAKSTD
jgi:hypothetical protein